MNVLKVKLKVKESTLEASYETEQGDQVDFKGTNIVHKDLEAALEKLSSHLGAICELEDVTEVRATGFTIGGEGDHLGAVLIGRKGLMNNRILNLCSPFVKFKPDLEPYEGAHALHKAIKAVQAEAVEYLEGRKVGGPSQGDLFNEVAAVLSSKGVTVPQFPEDRVTG